MAKMTREQAMDVLKNVTSYYGIDSEVVSAIHIAISDMEYCAEVKRYGSELAMMIAHHEKDMKEREEFIKECRIFEEQMKEWREENG